MGLRAGVVAVVSVWATGLVVTSALAGHGVRFLQGAVPAGQDVTLELRVPEAGDDHNPEGTQDHHTKQVKVTVPPEFDALGCVPPDGWDCVRTGELFRYFRDSQLVLERESSFTFGVYVTAPTEGGTWGFRTEQVYNDGHETRFTVEGGTAPTVEVEGAAAPSPQPTASAPSPSPSPATDPTTTASPTPTQRPSEAAPSPAPAATGATPAAPTTGPSAVASPAPSPSPSAGDEPEDGVPPALSSPSEATPDDVTLAAEQAVPGGLGGLERAALSLVVVAGTWAVVEFRARRSDHP